MKKFILGKMRKGESSSPSSHRSGSRSRDREEVEQEHQLVPFTPLERMLEPLSGLMLNHEELGKFSILRTCGYDHTALFDPQFMNETGMSVDFSNIFSTIGWMFWQVNELGIELLTQEFLCTLKSNPKGVYFRMFNMDFNLSWSELSTALGFDHDCNTDLEILEGLDIVEFWNLISGSNDCTNPRPLEIHNPTLRFMFYWIIVTLFPGTRVQTVGYAEMQ